MKKEEKPRAAEGILKNAYVDDICDSVNNVKEAKALMSDIDEVLDVSGLHVKQWISSEQSDISENPSKVTKPSRKGLRNSVASSGRHVYV